MLKTLIQKELRAIISSPKFTATFAVCSVLMLLSVYTGVREYRAAMKQYENSTQLADQQVREQDSWSRMATTVIREPEPMQIFVSGLTYDLGRWSGVSSQATVKLNGSTYSDDPIFSIFRHIDFAFIVQFILSLFAILFTYDAVNGERESGTLRLVLCNAVPRARYLIAKCVGAWLGLIVPILIPILLSLLLVIALGVPMTATNWEQLLLIIALSLLLFSFFTVLGVFMSTLSRHSSVSFLVSLVVWVLLVLIIPRAGAMTASQVVPVPGMAEIEGQRDTYAKDQWNTFQERMVQRMRDEKNVNDMPEDERDDVMWERMQREDSLRRIVTKDIEHYESQLQEEVQRRKDEQRHLAFALSRLSPASAYQLAAMQLATTDIGMKSRYLDAMSAFRDNFLDYTQKKAEETGSTGGVRVELSSETGIHITQQRSTDALDISGLPKFEQPKQTLASIVEPIIPDFGIVALATLLAFAGAFIGFLKFDVR